MTRPSSSSPRFFALRSLLNPDTNKRIELLRAACEARGVEYIDFNIKAADHTDLPELGLGDMLFQIARGPMFMTRLLANERVATMYKSYQDILNRRLQLIPHQQAGLPMPKTIHYLTKDPVLLSKYAKYCGGFPLILKAMGGSHGVGVMKIDSFSSLVSVVDHALGDTKLIMRELIETNTSERLVVLGSQVVDSYQYRRQGEDIRSNAGTEMDVTPKEYPKQMQMDAVRAVNLLGIEFGGVDMLMDEAGKHYIIEANVPYCNFPRAQLLSGTDIAGMVVDHLLAKVDHIREQHVSGT